MGTTLTSKWAPGRAIDIGRPVLAVVAAINAFSAELVTLKFTVTVLSAE